MSYALEVANTKLWSNPVMTEDQKNYVMKFNMTGTPKNQIKVEMDGNLLTVRAERHEKTKSDSKKMHYTEELHKASARTLTLPESIDQEAVTASFKSGVLTVTIPKSNEALTSQIKQITVT